MMQSNCSEPMRTDLVLDRRVCHDMGASKPALELVLVGIPMFWCLPCENFRFAWSMPGVGLGCPTFWYAALP